MKMFTRHRGSNPSLNSLSVEEASTLITSKVMSLEPARQLNREMLQFAVEKLVLDILDYCHRWDFPYALVYTCVDLVRKRLNDSEEAAEDSESEITSLPLSEIKMDDTTFKFDTGSIAKTIAPNNVGLLSDLDFDSIKPRLNLYRRLVSR